MDLDTTSRVPGTLAWQPAARDAVTALYQAHADGLIRLAVVMLGDRGAAEDVVQEAFCGLYRRWDQLADPGSALPYVRSAVLNGCRSVLRRRSRRHDRPGAEAGWQTAESAESSALLGEEHREVLAALRRLPARQREALVLPWTWPGGGWIGNFKPLGQPLSWTADGRFLAFQQWGGRLDSTASVRILDTAAPGTSLRASKLVVSFRNLDSAPDVGDGNTLITPDGSSVIVSATTTAGGGQHYRTILAIDRYSAATGHLTGRRDRWHVAGWQDVLWTSRSGGTLIIIDARGKAGAGVTGVLDRTGFTPLPGAPAAVQIAW